MSTRPHSPIPCLFLLLVATSSPGGLHAADPQYAIRDITPEGYINATAYDINRDGDVVGVAQRYTSGTAEEAYFFYDFGTDTTHVLGEGLVKPPRRDRGHRFSRGGYQ